jgi:hypothetical protein
MARLAVIRQTLVARKWRWLAITAGFVTSYYAALLASVVVRFGELPNYVTLHPFFHNVAVIIRSTPSLRDMIPIMLDEWLLEVGFMNRDYGHGIAEWSVELIPSTLLIVVALGALVATNVLLLKRSRSCAGTTLYSGATATGLGAALVGFASITVMWVVCCASPTWAVALALLGVGVSTAFALQPFGIDITLAGFGLMLAASYVLAGDHPAASAATDAPASPRLAQHQA